MAEAKRLILLHGTDAARQQFTPLPCELICTSDTFKLYIGDGATAGGLLVGGLDSVSWSSVQDKPLVFPPESHEHAISEVTDLETTLGGKEAALGNPTADGQILSSSTAGVREWIDPPSGGGGGVMSDWVTFTPNTYEPGNFSVRNGWWRRVGDSMEVYVFLKASGTGGSDFYVDGPSGYVADTSKITSVLYSAIGEGMWFDSGNNRFSFQVMRNSGDNRICAYRPSGGGWIGNNLFAANDEISLYWKVPIVGWSSNIQLAPAAIEYAFNTDTTNASCIDDLHYGAGASGELTPRSNPTGVSIAKRVQFATAIQPTDVIAVEIDPEGSGRWQVGAYVSVAGGSPVESFRWQNDLGTYIGYGGIKLVTGSDRKLDILFGKYKCGSNSTDGNWNHADMASTRWRVRKSSGASMAEVPTDVVAQVEVKTGANVSVAHATYVKLPLNTETKDTAGEFDTSTYRYTAKQARTVLVEAQIQYWYNGTNSRWIDIRKNGTYIKGITYSVPSGNDSLMTLTCVVDLAAGDYLEVYAFQNSNTTLTVYAGSYLRLIELSPRRLI